jgi:hypothetical protein
MNGDDVVFRTIAAWTDLLGFSAMLDADQSASVIRLREFQREVITNGV